MQPDLNARKKPIHETTSKINILSHATNQKEII